MPIKKSQRALPRAVRKNWIEEHSKVRPSLLMLAWILGILAVFGFFCGMVLQMWRINLLQRALIGQSLEVYRLTQQLDGMNDVVSAYCVQPAPAAITTGAATEPTSTSMLPTAGSTSQNGSLDRGALSLDGTKFAGYDETTKGKIGVAVETLVDSRIRHVVLFTRAQSTGAGTPYEAEMSVRWKSASTLEYDVLETVNGTQIKKTETVTIGF